MNLENHHPGRREFLTLTGAGAAVFALAGSTSHAQNEDQLSVAEKEKIALVNEFCDAWETMDVEKIAGYFADDITFRMIDEAPRVDGKETLKAAIKGFLASRTSARFEVLRSAAVGNLVIDERIDHFEREDGKDAFHVAGFFVVKDGKITEWQDYRMPQDA